VSACAAAIKELRAAVDRPWMRKQYFDLVESKPDGDE